MFEKTRGYFSSAPDFKSDLSKEADDLRIAVVSVLVSAAHADSDFSDEEHKDIVEIATTKLGLGKKEIENLLTTNKLDLRTSDAILEIRSSFSPKQCEQVYAFTLSVIGSDMIVENEESKFVAQLRTDLGISLEQALRIRKETEGTKVNGFKELVEASADVIAGTTRWLKGKE